MELDVKPVFRKSSYSGGNGGNCVEVATNVPGKVFVQDSKHRDGGTLAFTSDVWTKFTDAVKTGEFNV